MAWNFGFQFPFQSRSNFNNIFCDFSIILKVTMNLFKESTFLKVSISFSKIQTILFFKNSELLGVMATDVPVNDLHEFIYYPLVRKQ